MSAPTPALDAFAARAAETMMRAAVAVLPAGLLRREGAAERLAAALRAAAPAALDEALADLRQAEEAGMGRAAMAWAGATFALAGARVAREWAAAQGVRVGALSH